MTPSQIAPLPDDYIQLLEAFKDRVRQAQATARRTVNAEPAGLYWSIGRDILTRQNRQDRQGWGVGVVRRLAEDLRAEFPSDEGFSARSLQYMATFAGAWATGPIAQQSVAQLPWGHVTVLLDKLKDQGQRQKYAAAAAEYGWSGNVVLNMMMNRSMERTGTAPSNFIRQLAHPGSELARQAAKDPCVFEFLDLSGEVAERDLEQALADRIVETLQEFGPPGMGMSRSTSARYWHEYRGRREEKRVSNYRDPDERLLSSSLASAVPEGVDGAFDHAVRGAEPDRLE